MGRIGPILRKTLLFSSLFAPLLGIAGCPERRDEISASLGIGEIGQLYKDYSEKAKSIRKQYIAGKGSYPSDMNKVSEALMNKELYLYYKREHSRVISPFDQFLRDTYKPFTEEVSREYKSQLQRQDLELFDEFDTDSVKNLACLKLAMDEVFARRSTQPKIIQNGIRMSPDWQQSSGPNYLKSANLIIDCLETPFSQCRSASTMFLIEALKRVNLAEGEMLVEILSKDKNNAPHMQIGLLTRNKRLIVFENTVLGTALQDFGQLENIQSPILVLDAKHALTQKAIEQLVFRDQTIVFDNRPEDWKRGSNVGFLEGIQNTFEVNPNDLFSIGGEISYESVPSTPQTKRVYDKLPSPDFADSGISSLYGQSSKTQLDLFLSSLDSTNHRVYTEYVAHSQAMQLILDGLNRELKKCKDPEKIVEIAKKSINDLDNYIARHDLQNKYKKMYSSINRALIEFNKNQRKKLEIRYPSSPNQVHNIIVHNAQLRLQELNENP